MKTKHGPLWQLQQNVESKKAILKTIDDDEKRIHQRRAETLAELIEYEEAVAILGKQQTVEE